MQSWRKVYAKKYPGALIQATEDHFTVCDADGNLLVAAGKNGHGIWVDQQNEAGAQFAHSLDMPKATATPPAAPQQTPALI